MERGRFSTSLYALRYRSPFLHSSINFEILKTVGLEDALGHPLQKASAPDVAFSPPIIVNKFSCATTSLA